MITVTNNTITKTETVIPAIVDEGRPLQQSIGHVEHVSPMLDEQISSPHTLGRIPTTAFPKAI